MCFFPFETFIAFMCFLKDALVTFRNLQWLQDDVEEGWDSGPDKTNSRWFGNAETSREPSRASGNYKPAFIEVVIV